MAFMRRVLVRLGEARYCINNRAQRNIPSDTVHRMIRFISELEDQIIVHRSFGSQGSPWEFNLRDTLRWLNLLNSSDPLLSTAKVDNLLRIAIQSRFRSENGHRQTAPWE